MLSGARLSAQPIDGAGPGEIVAIDDDGMTVACQGGAVSIASVHPAGKRRIAPHEWARGRGIGVGERLS
jgi:methionyl-tRNA formyltransferase